MTQRTASMTLDLPQPLGPTMAVMLLSNGTVTGSTNDLKPASLMDLRRMRGIELLNRYGDGELPGRQPAIAGFGRA